uniref:Uncharacterized protein n=1 Tax=Pseudo-nitzschia australis TaxID=44445 RepID=A0A7S4ADZ8_9STRA
MLEKLWQQTVNLRARYNQFCVLILISLALYASYIQIAIGLICCDYPQLGSNDGTGEKNLRETVTVGNSIIDPSVSSQSAVLVLDPSGSLFHPFSSISTDTQQQQQRDDSRRVLVIAAAPRSIKHIVSLWSSLECFTADVDHVVLSAPTWSQPIMERFLAQASFKIPRFSSGRVTLEGMVAVNDRYDVGLWCDALAQMGIEPTSVSASAGGDIDEKNRALSTSSSPFDEISLLNDSVYALREFTGVASALKDRNVSMTSLNYCLNDLQGTGPSHYWLESVWRGFDERGIRTFVDYSCRPVSDPLFCNQKWWGQKGCIVENFERAMARQFPREDISGIFPSDVPKELLTRKHSHPTWVRHPPYWDRLVKEQDFPASKLNWKGMIDSIDDERLDKCTMHLDRLWLLDVEGFDFSVAKAAI